MPPSHPPTLWRTCRVLANRKRLQILALLIRQPNQTVSTVARHMKLSMPAASQYLRALEARGLLTCRRVGLRAEYRPSATTTQGAGGEIVAALRLVFRAVKNGMDTFDKLQAATHISARALSRHLAKLEARGFVKGEMEVYAVVKQSHPFGRALARLAGQ